MKKRDLSYYFGMTLLIFISICDISKIINIDGSLRDMLYLVSMLAFIFKILNTKYNKKNIIPIILIGVYCLYMSYILDEYTYLMNFFAGVGIVEVDIKRIIKIDFLIKLFYVIIHSIIYFHDLIFNYNNVVSSLVLTNAYGARHSLYFSHPNTANAIVIWMIIDIIIIAKNKKIATILGTITVAFYSYFTVSRTSIIIFALFLLISYLYKKGIFLKTISFFKNNIFLIMVIINILIISTKNLLSIPFFYNLNIFLSKRLSYSCLAINLFGFHTLPNNITKVLSNTNLIIDNFYIRSFVSYGFLTLIIMTILYYTISNRRKIETYEVAILIIFPIYLFNELFLFNIGRAIPLLVIANMLLNKRKGVQN